MTAVIRLALPRLSASIMISCSISQLFTGTGCDCRTNASQPRTDSWKRTKISPLANSRAVCAVTWTSSSLAPCSASSGCARPEKSIRFLRLSVQSWLNVLPWPYRGRDRKWKVPSYEANRTEVWPACQVESPRGLFGFCRRAGRRGLFGGSFCCLSGRGARALALHPAFDIALRTRRYRQRTRRDVVAHHRARARVGPVADGHRSHEHGVGPGAHVGADRGAGLGRSVVVDEHAGGADVALFADVGVSHVGQVRHLGARADGRVLGLDERTELALGAQHRAGPQVREGADVRPGADRDVGQGGARAHDAVAADLGAAQQLRLGMDDGVAADRDVDVYPG